MKKLLKVSAALLFAVALFAQTDDATAQTAQPVPTVKLTTATPVFKMTTIKGDITVPAQFSSSNYGSPQSLAGFQCSNLVIIANSQATKPKPPDATGFWFPQPVWTRTVNATGTWSSGKCSYSLAVPGNQSFGLSAGTNGSWNCDVVSVALTNTPTWQQVPTGTTKTDNLTVSSVTCTVIG